MSRPSHLGVVALALAWATASCVAEPVGVERATIVDGAPVEGNDAVVALVPRRTICEEGPASVVCSGVLISPRVVLTAAHCFDVFGSEGRSYEVYFGSDVFGSTGRWLLGEQVRIHPEHDGESHTHDVALLRLAEAAPVEPLEPSTMAIDDTLVGIDARVVGFGVTRDDALPEGVKREGTTRITAVTETTFTAERAPSMTCQGDSGGPVLVDVDGTEQLAGVTVSGDPACDLEAVNARMDVLLDSFIAPFVEEAAAAPVLVPEGSVEPSLVCEATCETHEDCPFGMLCEAGIDARLCRLPARGPGGLADACTSADQCTAEGSVCARVWGAECRCHVPCSTFRPPADDEGGCAVSGAPPAIATWLVPAWLLLRRRRR